MNRILKQNLIEWNRNYNTYQKIQHIYLAASVLLVFVAGASSLFNFESSDQIILIIKALLAVFVINLLTYILSKAFIFEKIGSMRNRNTKNDKK